MGLLKVNVFFCSKESFPFSFVKPKKPKEFVLVCKRNAAFNKGLEMSMAVFGNSIMYPLMEEIKKY